MSYQTSTKVFRWSLQGGKLAVHMSDKTGGKSVTKKVVRVERFFTDNQKLFAQRGISSHACVGGSPHFGMM